MEWRVDGLHNLIFLVIALVAVVALPLGIRELVMVAATAASYFTTAKGVHDANEFTFGPIKESAWIFAGLFATMTPALDYMVAHAGRLGLRSDMQFYCNRLKTHTPLRHQVRQDPISSLLRIVNGPRRRYHGSSSMICFSAFKSVPAV